MRLLILLFLPFLSVGNARIYLEDSKDDFGDDETFSKQRRQMGGYGGGGYGMSGSGRL